ncbi:MAG TPA: hypothetical protein VHB53_01590 [Solirubrobacterales bacterium]|nr:hypothetical protein [Solirubrobacterales bacterium]
MKLRGRMGCRFARITPPLMRSPFGRSLLLRDTMAHPRRVPADAAAAPAAEYAATPDFEARLEATSASAAARPSSARSPSPGEEERLIPKKSRLLDELPPRPGS